MKDFLNSAGMRALKGAVAALALASAFATPSLAITNPPSFAPRQFTTQQLHFFRKTFNYNDANIGSGVQFGSIPVNSYIDAVQCQITTAFNAGTTNTVQVGVTQTGGELLSTTTVTAGFYNGTAADMGLVETGAASGNVNGITTALGGVSLWVRYAQTGTAATAGSATCIVKYIPPMDQ